jgi:hypothetical protein
MQQSPGGRAYEAKLLANQLKHHNQMIAAETLLYFFCFGDRFSPRFASWFYADTQRISMKNQYVDSSIEGRARETNCHAVERDAICRYNRGTKYNKICEGARAS